MKFDRDTPPSSPTIGEPLPAGERPLFLYEILEKEFRSIHGKALELDAEYAAVRNAAIKTAKEELAKAIQERVEEAGEPELIGDALTKEVEAEIYKNPALINGPACRELYRRIHVATEKEGSDFQHTALCLSGGGIRSATFALGVLQGLARKGVLKDLAYLSTVSGGGYIGSWLSSWIKREIDEILEKGKKAEPPEPPKSREQLEREGRDKVFKLLAADEKPSRHPGTNQSQGEADLEPRQPFETEPTAIQHLRQYSNYLTPALGLLSGDSWTLAATVARNLLLNWLLIVPAFLFVLLLPRIAVCIELTEFGHRNHAYQAGWAAAAIGFVCTVYALAALFARYGKNQVAVLKHCVLPLAGASACITLAWLWSRAYDPQYGFFEEQWRRVAFYMGWGAAAVICAAPISIWLRRKQGLKPAQHVGKRITIIAVIFALTGLLVCWVGGKAADSIFKTPKKEESAKGAPPTAPTWTMLSRQGNDTNISVWALSQNGEVREAVVPKLKEEPDAPKSDKYLEVRAATLATCFGFPLLLALIFLANTLITGVLSHLMSDEDREWYARASGWAILTALIGCVLNLLVLHGPNWLVHLWEIAPKLISSVAGGSALLTILGGKSDKAAASHEEETKLGPKDLIVQNLARFAAPIFVMTLVMGFSLLTTILLQKFLGEDVDLRSTNGGALSGHSQLFVACHLWVLLITAFALFLLAWFASWCVNINKFSLHSMYRNRLIRAYLGATNSERAPNVFTGFDPEDNFEISKLGTQKPFHVINTALNLVSGSKLAWQQRMAESFTITPQSCGSALLGYRDSSRYGKGQQNSMTLGTALSISGAAVSPNHGYNSSPLIAFILTFFNARLGGWFGNPGIAGANSWEEASPKYALVPLVAEALGLTNDEHPFVYLSDGGHFENLGLYEMVLRRCRVIVVCDAGCDADYGFEDLGNAVSKIRVDLGVKISFDPDIAIRKTDPNAPGGSNVSRGRHCAVGRIHYSDVDVTSGDEKRDGVLIYLKPTLTGGEPMDVFHYEREHKEFPHESTTDQWFSEAQFECYRALGAHTIEEIYKAKPSGTNQNLSGLQGFQEYAAAHAGASRGGRSWTLPDNEWK